MPLSIQCNAYKCNARIQKRQDKRSVHSSTQLRARNRAYESNPQYKHHDPSLCSHSPSRTTIPSSTPTTLVLLHTRNIHIEALELGPRGRILGKLLR